MKQLYSIIKKELRGYIDHPTAYILVVVFLVLNNFLYFRTSIIEEVASMRAMFQLLPWVLLFFVSALSMRTWSEENREGTLQMLMAYPVKIWQVVLGKYIATTKFISCMIILTLIIPVSLSSAGDFDWGVLVSQYLGAMFVVMAMVAVGQWASSLTKNQVVSFIISVAVLFVLIFIGMDVVILSLPYPLNVAAQQLGFLSHYTSLTRGVLDLRDILYFLSLSFVFLALSYAWLTRIKIRKNSANWRTLQTSIAVLIVIAVVINLFGQSFTVRVDLTEQNLYSLSKATESVLGNLDDTVRLTLYRSKKLPTQVELVSRDIQDILKDYQKFGGRHVSLSIKYPDEDEEVVQEAQMKGVPPIRFNVVREDEFTLQEGYLGLVIEYLDKSETLPFIQKIDDLEYKLTRSILTLQNDERPVIGYVSDFGGKELAELTNFKQAMLDQFTVQTVKLATTEENDTIQEIGENIEALIIAAPTQKYSDQAIQEVQKYIDRGGKIFWMLSGIAVNQQNLSAVANETGLETILASQGVTLNKDMVADLASHETVNFSAGMFTYMLPYPYWVRVALSPHILIGNVTQVAFPWSSSITLSDDVKDRSTVIATTTEQGVHQTSAFDLNPEQTQKLMSLQKEKYNLAVVIQDIPSVDGGQEGRWVVISNQGFLDDNIVSQHPQNIVLALNSLDWLNQNEALLSIRSKDSTASTLIWESNKQQAMAKWGNVVGVPLIIVIAGGGWLWRRRRISHGARFSIRFVKNNK